MDFSFSSMLNWFANSFFGGSTTLAGLAALVMAWAVAAVICLNFKAPPVYSIVPMIPMAIFMSAYGVVNETVMIFIVLVCAIMAASEFKKVVD